jgi:acetylornithine deacetylase
MGKSIDNKDTCPGSITERNSHLDPICLLEDLVRINSVNAFYPNGPGEGELAKYIEAYWGVLGIECRRQSVLPGRDNIIAFLPGRDSSKRLLLEAHMDTVSTEGMSIAPWVPEQRDGKLYGRGSCDTKAGLACMMAAMAQLRSTGTTPVVDVIMAAVVDEEYSCLGVNKLCEELQADAAIVAEPTEMQTVIASKGVLRWQIHAIGRSAHSSKVYLGINAIEHMAELILLLRSFHDNIASRTHTLLGTATANIGLISGGVQVNFVPDRCSIQIDRRLLPGERVADVLGEYQALLGEAMGRIPGSQFTMDPPLLVDPSFETPSESRIAQASAQTLKRLGYSDNMFGVPFGSDASKIRLLGIDTIIFGPGSIDQAHSAVEYVDIEQVRHACEYYQLLMKEFLP